MRPRKVILLVDNNEQALSVRSFVLDVRGPYRIIKASTSQDALDVLERLPEGQLDLLITDLLMPGMDGNELVRRAKQIHRTLPTLITSEAVSSYDRALVSDAFLPRGTATTGEILAQIRILAQRKRGPKPHYRMQYVHPEAAA